MDMGWVKLEAVEKVAGGNVAEYMLLVRLGGDRY
jgi:hypothetical protein